MKNKILCFMLSGILVASSFTSCGNSSDSASTSDSTQQEEYGNTTSLSSSSTSDREDTEIPELVRTVHKSYTEIASTVPDYGIEVGDIKKLDEDSLIYYNFALQSNYNDNTAGGGSVSFQYSSDDNSFYGYDVSLGRDEGTEGIKKTISLIISASESISISDTKNDVDKLIKSYDGKDYSDVITEKKFRYAIEPPIISDGEDSVVIYPKIRIIATQNVL